MEKNFYNIFKTFLKVGTLLLGGGYVILPLLQCELAEKKNWLTDDELCEFYALGQSVPGVIAANVAIFTGYKLAGQKGALAAVAGIVTPAFISIILVAEILQELINLKSVQSIFWGVGIGVILLISLAVKEMWTKSVVDKFTTLIFFLSVILSALFKVSPVYIIVGAAILGIVYNLAYLKNRGEDL